MHYVSGAIRNIRRYALLPPILFSLALFFACNSDEPAKYSVSEPTTYVATQTPKHTQNKSYTPVPTVLRFTPTPTFVTKLVETPTPTASDIPSPVPSSSPQYSIVNDCPLYTSLPTITTEPVVPTSIVNPTNTPVDISKPASIQSIDKSISSPVNYDISLVQSLSNVCGISAQLPIENPDLVADPLVHYVRSIAVSDGLFLEEGHGLEVGWIKCNYSEQFDLPCYKPALFVAVYYGGDNWGRTFYDIEMSDKIEVAITNSFPENNDPYTWYALVKIKDEWNILYKDILSFQSAPRAVEMIENYEQRNSSN